MKPEQFARMKEILLKITDLSKEEQKAYLSDVCKDDLELRRDIESILTHEKDSLDILKTSGVIPGHRLGSTITADLFDFSLSQWRLESLKTYEKSIHKRTEATGNWQDESSRKAASYILEIGIELPWDYGDDFGSTDFRVTGLRAGGTGVVYFVESTKPDRKTAFAAKTLQSFLKNDYLDLPSPLQEKFSKAFLEETLPWLAMSQHPHIVSVQHLKKIIHPKLGRRIPFVFSNYMPKGNFRRRLEERERLSYCETLILGIQLCDGLLHAYAHGLDAHRDIKPENVMIYQDNIIKVTDFSANVIGTPGYMAPEQVILYLKSTGEDLGVVDVLVDHRADQFAIGLVMLEACSEESPFSRIPRSYLDREQAKSFVEGGIAPIADDLLPATLLLILNRALSLKPADRYPQLSDLREDLVGTYEDKFGSYVTPEVTVDDSAEWWYYRGKAYAILGYPAFAVEPYEKASKRYKLIPNTEVDLARCLVDLGDLYRQVANFGKAETVFKEALEIYRQIPEVPTYHARCLMYLGVLYSVLRRFKESEKAYNEALKKYRNIPGTIQSQSRCLENLGFLYRMTDRLDEAEKTLLMALSNYRNLPGTELDQATCCVNLGGAYSVAKRFDEAEKIYSRALEIYRSIPGLDLKEARCLGNLAIIFDETGRYDEAEKAFKDVLNIFLQFPGTELDQARCRAYLGDLYRHVGRFDDSKEVFGEAIRTFRQIPGAEIHLAEALSNFALLYRDWKNPDRASQYAKEALKLCKTYPMEATTEIRENCRRILGKGDEV